MRATPRPRWPPTGTQASLKSDLERQTEGREKTGVFTGAFATSPVSGQPVPVFVADYVLMGYGTGAIMAVPGQDERDWEFATRFELPIIRTVAPPQGWEGEAFTGEGPAINSANDEISLDGLGIAEAKAAITEWLQRKGSGEGAVTYKLRDWLFSRQRYWGEPFPVVFDDEGRVHAVPDDQLPVQLPDVPDYSPRTFAPDDADSDPEPPLGRVPEWVDVEMDLGEGPRRYRRETNTMPNWAGSCWYFLRYLDPANQDTFCDKENEAYWMGPRGERAPGVADPGGVDLYVGGVEHAVLHLLYARFWHKVLHDLGYVTSEEPFRRLLRPGHDPGLRLPRHPRSGRPGRRGGRGRRRVVVAGRVGRARARQDGQVAEERRDARRDVRELRRRHLPGLRDVDGSAGRVAAVGDPGRRRVAALPAAAVAQRRRRADRRADRRRRAGTRGAAPRPAPDRRRGGPRLRGHAVQHRRGAS